MTSGHGDDGLPREEEAAGPDDLAATFLHEQLSRRGALGVGAVAISATLLSSSPGGRRLLAARAESVGRAAPRAEARVERLRRDADQLSLDVALVGFTVAGARGSELVADPTTGGYVGFFLPGQSLGESVDHLPQANNQSALTAAEIAGPTLLAFDVPPSTRLPFSLSGLLDWADLTARWTTKGVRLSSRLEAPYRLLLKPDPGLRWLHDTAPRPLPSGDGDDGDDGGASPTTELWHTRAVGRNAAGDPDPRQTAQQRTWVTKALPSPLTTPLNGKDRDRIVALAKQNSSVKGAAPVQAPLLLLSSLGASLDLHGDWPDSNDLLTWDHRSVMGRDGYVKVVYAGYLAPWGHPAVVVKETWRAMLNLRDTPQAVLEQRATLIVRDPVVDTEVLFARKNGLSVRGLALPFTSVRSLVRQSPTLDSIPGNLSSGSFIPQVDGASLRLPFRGTDWVGNDVVFSSEVRFVGGRYPSQAAATSWNTDTSQDRFVDLGGQPAAVSPEGDGPPGCTTLPLGAAAVTVKYLAPGVLGGRERAPFHPVLAGFRAQVPAAQALSAGGTGGAARAAGAAMKAAADSIAHTYATPYLSNARNAGGVVLRATVPVATPVPGETTGGLVGVPSTYQGLSTRVGAVIASAEEALGDLAKGEVDPTRVFDGINLLGQIPLSDIVRAGMPSLAERIDQLGKAITEVVDGRQTVTLRLSPALQKKDFGPLVFQPGQLNLVSTVATGGGRPAEHSVDVRLTKATLELGGVVLLPITDLRVTSTTAAPFHLDLTLGEVAFLGPLGFVQTLAEILAPFVAEENGRAVPSYRSGGVRNAQVARTGRLARQAAAGRSGAARVPLPDVDVDLAGIHLRQDIALPDVALGAFNLSGLGFGLGVDLLFTGDLLVGFNFATHENPFVVTYGPFGGGGYVALELSGGDVTHLEVSLMVAGAVGINLGVAAGAITASAGFVLGISSASGLSLTAFFRATGHLEVLGLVSLSAVFEISLTFLDTDPATLTGTATLSFKVEVLFVSKTVSASVSKTIAGGAKKSGLRAVGAAPADDPLTFADVYPDQTPWLTYAGAFTA